MDNLIGALFEPLQKWGIGALVIKDIYIGVATLLERGY
jgi:hypothetical protein